MFNIKLPIWADKGELNKLKTLALTWWVLIKEWLLIPLDKHNPETCDVAFLNLLAWERGITRFKGEALDLYRLRVKYAFINAIDAGSKNGFKRIFSRLQLGAVHITERANAVDWDVIGLNLDNEQISGNEGLLRELVNTYGRSCRRYFLSTTTGPIPLIFNCTTFEMNSSYNAADYVFIALPGRNLVTESGNNRVSEAGNNRVTQGSYPP